MHTSALEGAWSFAYCGAAHEHGCCRMADTRRRLDAVRLELGRCELGAGARTRHTARISRGGGRSGYSTCGCGRTKTARLSRGGRSWAPNRAAVTTSSGSSTER